MRKQADRVYRIAEAQHHQQALDTERHPGAGRHTAGECCQPRCIRRHHRQAARTTRRVFIVEAARLILGIDDFVIAIGKFETINHQFETCSDRRWSIAQARVSSQLGWIVVDKHCAELMQRGFEYTGVKAVEQQGAIVLLCR